MDKMDGFLGPGVTINSYSKTWLTVETGVIWVLMSPVICNKKLIKLWLGVDCGDLDFKHLKTYFLRF